LFVCNEIMLTVDEELSLGSKITLALWPFTTESMSSILGLVLSGGVMTATSLSLMVICKEIRVILTTDSIIVVAFPTLVQRYFD
jgi:hypothetical protein